VSTGKNWRINEKTYLGKKMKKVIALVIGQFFLILCSMILQNEVIQNNTHFNPFTLLIISQCLLITALICLYLSVFFMMKILRKYRTGLTRAAKELDDVIIHIKGQAYNSALILSNAIKKDLTKFSANEIDIDKKAHKMGERYVGCKNAIRCTVPLQECPLSLTCKDYWPTN
jgi:hypothetical protein